MSNDIESDSSTDPNYQQNHDADESEFVDPADLEVQRDSSGDVLPQTVQAGSLGKIRVRPLTYGDVQEYFGSGTNADVSPDQIAELFQNHLVRPDLAARNGGRLDGEYIASLKPLAPRDILLALLEVSGVEADVEMDESGGAQVAVAEGN